MDPAEWKSGMADFLAGPFWAAAQIRLSAGRKAGIRFGTRHGPAKRVPAAEAHRYAMTGGIRPLHGWTLGGDSFWASSMEC